MEGSRQAPKEHFPSVRRGDKPHFLPASSSPITTTPRSISSPLKPLGEGFEIRIKTTISEAAVPSIESPTLASGSLQEKQLLSGAAQGHRETRQWGGRSGVPSAVPASSSNQLKRLKFVSV